MGYQLVENKKKLMIIELNELNVEFINQYIQDGLLPNFQHELQDGKVIKTTSETTYEHLEPWIQWVTFHTGQTYKEHKIFRLGDITGTDTTQIFEALEDKNITVGAVSPMNASNRAKSPDFFLPDPWTGGKSVGPPMIQKVNTTISKIVNTNASGAVNIFDLVVLAKTLICYGSPQNLLQYLKLALGSRGRNKWRKAIFLDTLLADIYSKMLRRHKTNFSTLFLNAGAHIQHHYFFNSSKYMGEMHNPEWYLTSESDPLLETLKAYDRLIGHLRRHHSSIILFATGLSQVPYEKTKYYWRITDHNKFISRLGIEVAKISPRMSRDFLLEFRTDQIRDSAAYKLANAGIHEPGDLFELDIRDKSIFVTLKYDQDISKAKALFMNDSKIDLYDDDFVFVAIKNGHHHTTGYLFGDTKEIFGNKRKDLPLSQVYTHIYNYF